MESNSLGRTHFRLLGSVEVESPTGPLGIGGMRQRRLLAILLLNVGTPVSFDRIVDGLWEEPPQSARQQVHNAVAGIRRFLSEVPDVKVETLEFGYRLGADPNRIDVHQFRDAVQKAQEHETQGALGNAADTLKSALSLWRGPALTGLEGRYLQSVALQLDEQRLVATERLFALQLRLGDNSSSLLSELVMLVGQHPLRESFRESLMLALYREGRQAEALAAFEECRLLLAEQLGLDPSPRLRQLHTQILRGEVETKPPPHTPVNTDTAELVEARIDHTPAIRFLPRATAEFIGRDAEITKLRSIIQEGSSTALLISAIDGMGGIGKTTLALHLAHQLIDQFPDGQYFLDLHGFSVGREPISPEQALDALLGEAGVPAELVPTDVEARSRLWRSRMAGERALVLLDNAGDESQIRPLIPGSPGTVVLVTSRRKLTALEGMFPVSLDVLPHGDAVDLFAQIVGAERVSTSLDSVSAVVSLCGRLPLAIRIAAARFRDREAWSMDELLAQLSTDDRRARFLKVGDRNVMAVLKVSYQYLSEEERLVFRLLSLHPGADFDAAAVAALCRLGIDNAEQCLESLLEHSLLVQHAAGRYEFHDLVRDCSRELSHEYDTDAIRQEAVHRILDYYLHLAHSVCEPLALHPFRLDPSLTYPPERDIPKLTPGQRMSLLEANYRGFLAACQYALDHGWYSHAWQIPCALMPFLSRRNYRPDAFRQFGQALNAARKLNDRHGEVACLTAMGIISRERDSKMDTAQMLIQQAIDISSREGNSLWSLQLSTELGAAQLKDGKILRAYETFAAAYDLAREVGDKHQIAALANNVGVACRDLGKLAEALEYFERSLDLSDGKTSDRSRISRMCNLGYVHHLMGQPSQAWSILKRTLEFSARVKSLTGEAVTRVALSEVCRARGELDPAIKHGRRSLALARRLNLGEIECMALSSLGETHLSMGNVDTAETVLKEAESTAVARRLPSLIARANEGLAHVYQTRNHPTASRQRWERAIEHHPDEAAAVEYARRHLQATHVGQVTFCPQCWIHSKRS